VTEPRRVGILISGRGSNMKALIEAAAKPGYPARIVTVLSNRADAAGLAVAKAAGIETLVLPHQNYPDRAAFDAALDDALHAEKVDIVCLAGFMRLFTAEFVERWRGRMLNIHPSLLPSFPGLHPQQQALGAGVRFSGCTVHFVTPEMDSGPIVAQAAVPCIPATPPRRWKPASSRPSTASTRWRWRSSRPARHGWRASGRCWRGWERRAAPRSTRRRSYCGLGWSMPFTPNSVLQASVLGSQPPAHGLWWTIWPSVHW
jgi:phosphoribosylglycinamide formyltransferase-1